MELYTKNGRPLQVSGSIVYSRSGQFVGHISGNKVYGAGGSYVGTIDSGRLVFRSSDNVGTGDSSSVAGNRVGMARANQVGSALWGNLTFLISFNLSHN